MIKEDRKGSQERRARFIAAYLRTLNATQAAIEVGYSAKTARAAASKLLARVDVTEAIAKAKVTALTKASITQDAVLSELWGLASSDVTDYVITDDGNLAPAPGKPASVMRAVSSLKRKTRVLPDGTVEREVEFRLWDKPGSLKLAGRHVGLFPQKDQAAIEAAAEAVVDRMVTKARQEKERLRTIAEEEEARRERAIDVGEAPAAPGGTS